MSYFPNKNQMSFRLPLSTRQHFFAQRISLSSARAFSTHRLTRTCPSCSKTLPTSLPACPNCWSIWNIPSDTSYHDIFALPKDSNPFVIDTALLKQRFRQMQATCHPDTWASRGLVRAGCLPLLFLILIASRTNKTLPMLFHRLSTMRTRPCYNPCSASSTS